MGKMGSKNEMDETGSYIWTPDIFTIKKTYLKPLSAVFFVDAEAGELKQILGLRLTLAGL
jgi:hypothetical protein